MLTGAVSLVSLSLSLSLSLALSPLFHLSDRSLKASAPWYSAWRQTLSELSSSHHYTGTLVSQPLLGMVVVVVTRIVYDSPFL